MAKFGPALAKIGICVSHVASTWNDDMPPTTCPHTRDGFIARGRGATRRSPQWYICRPEATIARGTPTASMPETKVWPRPTALMSIIA